MPDSWRYSTLGDIAIRGGTGLVDGPFGSNLPSSEYVRDGVPVIRGSNLSLGTTRFNDSGFVFVSEHTARRLCRSLCSAGDIVFTKKGTLGQTGLIPDDARYPQYLLSSNQMRLTVDRSVADPLFVYYYVSSAASRAKIVRDSEATGVPKTNLAYLRGFPILLPPLAEQRRIAAVVGALDDKIELNRKMSATLEAMARALFKSWFVDFDPVRAKAEGRDTGLSPEIAALFPDSFNDSELGEIPAEWGVADLGDLVSFEYGKPLKADDRRGGAVAVYGSNGVVGWHNQALIKGPGVVVGRKGNPGTVTWTESDFYPIDTTFYVVPRRELSLQFLFFALSAHDLPHLSADSAVPGLNRNQAYMSRQLLPPHKILKSFDRLVMPMRTRTYHAGEEARTLAALRDALLPRLISGEIRVAEVERIVAKSA